MAFTQDDLDRLDKAIAQGVLSLSFADGRSVTFSSFKELIERRNFVAQQLGQTAGRQRIFTEYTKGVVAPKDTE